MRRWTRVPIRRATSVDPIESAILQAGIARSFETGLAAYLVAETLADEQLKLGNSVIVDAVNAEEEGKDIWRRLSRAYVAFTVLAKSRGTGWKREKQPSHGGRNRR